MGQHRSRHHQTLERAGKDRSPGFEAVEDDRTGRQRLEGRKMSGGDFVTFGNRAVIALECRRLKDPDWDGAPWDSVGSWGEWKLWVADQNLCEYEHPEIANGTTGVVWYLAPFFRFLIGNWDPLLHEERLPPVGRSVGRSARDAYQRALVLYQG